MDDGRAFSVICEHVSMVILSMNELFGTIMCHQRQELISEHHIPLLLHLYIQKYPFIVLLLLIYLEALHVKIW